MLFIYRMLCRLGFDFHLQKAQYLGLRIGERCRIFTRYLGGEPYLVTIGSHVTLSIDVQLITHDGALWIFRDRLPNIEKCGRIDIDNNVFVGARSIVLPGTHIESNVIIGAGSVCKGFYESGFVYAGVPAKSVCTIEEYLEKNYPNADSVAHLNYERKRQFWEDKLVKKGN